MQKVTQACHFLSHPQWFYTNNVRLNEISLAVYKSPDHWMSLKWGKFSKILATGQILTTTLGLGRHHVLGLRRFLFTYYSHGSSFPLLHPDPDSHHHIFSILNTLLTRCWNSKSSQYVCWHGQSADVQCIVWRSGCPELIIK